jgi:MoaA/NifB/PqqE/SkfB family radical SAM enzyme
MSFAAFSPTHAQTLETLLQSPDWQDVVAQGLVDSTRAAMLTPPPTANVFSLPVEQLKAINGERVRDMIEARERDEDRLLAALGTWPGQWPMELPVRLSFLGLNLGFACDMQPRCVYCNQRPVEERMQLDDWRALLRGIGCRTQPPPSTDGDAEKGAYVYMTGGEPMLLGEGLWGDEGLVRTATESGCASNVNTNALALTPAAALGFVRAGLGRLHVSLDTHRPEVQDTIHQLPGRWAQVTRGIHNMQIAKALTGAEHPVIHINCVLTRLTADDFPEFLRFLLGMKPLVEGGIARDFDMHLIPVGGEQNARLRLSAEEYERFFTETWEAADTVWQEYQAARGIPAEQRGKLHEKMPFTSPYHRVSQRGDLSEWAECAAAGLPASLSRTERCYVGPTQGFILPDGAQYWCGGHATSRPQPVGNVLDAGVQDNIRQGLGQVQELPTSYCSSCAGATQAINQMVEASLRQAIREWLTPQEPTATAPPEPGFE